MEPDLGGTPHGSFAFSFHPDYTLWNTSGSWNLACARVLEILIDRKYTEKQNSRRCLIINIRNWSFQTPECEALLRDIIHRISTCYTSFHAAYVVHPDYHGLSNFLARHLMDSAPETLHIDTFESLDEAVAWLRSEGYTLPDLTENDFPVPVDAGKYLKDLIPPGE